MLVSRPPFGLVALGAFVLTLSACGGGGGGGSGTVPTSDYTATTTTTTPTTSTTTTTSTSTVAPIVYCCDSATAPTTISEMLQMNGGVSNGLAITTHIIDSSSSWTAVAGSGTHASPASITVNASGTVDTLTLSTVDAAAWSNTMTYTSADSFIFSVRDARADTIWESWNLADPAETIKGASLGLDTAPADQSMSTSTQKYLYMAWGSWASTEYLSTDTTKDIVDGFFVVGKPTDPANIPTSGTATYSGETIGQDLAGVIYGTFNATADFQNRLIAVSSSNTMLATVVQGYSSTSAAPQYDFAGSLSYAAGVNQFSGTISNPTSGMTGTATGMFYGPAAEEMGGVFEITNGTAAAKGLFVAN